ncbi:MAG: hypothetical protein HRT88_07460, partial [Lentisphaeraceae bacterium]|nr:hypothetical protein [Lentisphaeraceae bacterium]
AFSDVIEARDNRSLKTSLTGMNLRNFANIFKSNSYLHGSEQFASAWSRSLCKEKNKEELRDYIHKSYSLFAQAITKSKKKFQENFYQQSPIGYGIRSLVQGIAQACLVANLSYSLIVLDELGSSALSSEKELFRHTNLSYNLRQKFEAMVKKYDDIKETSLFKDINEFNPILLPQGNNERNSLLKVLVNQTYNRSEIYKELSENIAKRKKQNFGTKYILKLITSSNASEVYKFLDTHVEQLKKLPEVKLNAFITTLVQVMGDYKYRNSAKNISGPFYDLQIVKTAVSGKARYNEFLKKEIENSDYNYQRDAALLINDLLVNDYEKAKKLFAVVLKKLKRYRLRNSNRYSNNSSSVSQDFFSRCRNEGANSIAKLKLLQAVMPGIRFKGQNGFNAGKEIISMVKDISYKTLRAYRDNKETKDEARFLTVEAMLKSSITLINSGKYPAVIFFKNALLEANDKEYVKIATLLNQNKSLTADTKKELLLYSKYCQDYRKSNNTVIPADLLTIYSKYSTNQKIHIGTRLYAMRADSLLRLFRQDKTSASQDLFFKTCNLLAKNTNSSSDSSLIHDFMTLLVAFNDRGEHWQKAAKAMITSLETLRNKHSNYFNMSKGSSSYYSRFCFSLLDLYCATGDVKKSQKLLSSIPHLQKRAETYFILLKNKKIDLAHKNFTKNYKDIVDPSRRWSEIIKGDISAPQKEFLSKFSDDKDARYTAELYLAFVRDDRQAMKARAGKFASEGPQDKKLRKKLLQMLMTNHYTKKVVEKFSKDLFTSIDPTNVLSVNNSNLRKAYATYLLSQLATSKKEDLFEAYYKIVHAENKSHRRELVRYLSDSMLEHIKSKTLTAAALQKNVDKYILLGTELVGKAASFSYSHYLFSTTFILMHAKGDTEALGKWIDTLEAKDTKSLSNYYFAKCLVILDKFHTDEKGKVDNNKVNDLKAALLASPLLKKVYGGNTSEYQNLKRRLSEGFTKSIKTLDDLQKFKGQEILPELIKTTKGEILYNCFRATHNKNMRKSSVSTSDKKSLVYVETLEELRGILPENINTIGGYGLGRLAEGFLISDYKHVLKKLASIEDKGYWLQEIYVNILYNSAKTNKAAQGPQELLDFYVQFFTNDKISINERLQLYVKHRRFFNTPLRAEIVFTILDILPASKASGRTMKTVFDGLIEQASMCPLNNSTRPKLTSLAKQWQEKYNEKAYIGSKVFALDLKMRLGHDFKDNFAGFKYSYGAYMLLLHHGHYDFFKKQFSQNWSKINWRHDYFPSAYRNSERDRRFADNFKMSGQAGMGLFTKVMYFNFNSNLGKVFGVDDYSRGSWLQVRLVSIAQKFSSTSFKDEQMKQRVLLLILGNKKAAKIIQTEVFDFVKQETIEKILNPDYQIPRYSVVLYLAELLLHKKYQELEKAIVSCNNLKKKNSKMKSALERVANDANDEISQVLSAIKLSEVSSEELAKIEKFVKAFLDLASESYRLADLITTLSSLYVINGNSEKALELAKIIPKARTRYMYYSKLIKVMDNVHNWIKIEGNLEVGQQVKNAQKEILGSDAIKYLFSSRSVKKLQEKYGLKKKAVK